MSFAGFKLHTGIFHPPLMNTQTGVACQINDFLPKFLF
jgi:hypothetical protein